MGNSGQWLRCLIGAFGTAAATMAFAAGEAGMVKTLKGSVSIERGGQKQAAAIGGSVLESDRVVTGADGSVGITLRDNTMLSAGPNSVLELDKFAFDSTTHAGTLQASVKRGSLAVISGKIAATSPDAVSVRTPKTTRGVRGTEFIIEAGDDARGAN